MSEPSGGDVQRFSEMVKRHEQQLYKEARRLTGGEELAKDLVQETFSRAWERFADFEQGTNEGAWLSVILTRLFLDDLKHKKVVSKAVPQLTAFETSRRDINMTVTLIPDAALLNALNSLPEHEREVMELRLQGLSYKEIADKLQIPIGTVSVRLKRAVDSLRGLFTPLK